MKPCPTLHTCAADEIDALLDAGADINERDIDGYTALHLAIYSENTAKIWRLLQHQARTDIPNNYGDLPLHSAVRRGDHGTAYALKKHGAQLDARDSQGCSPLMIAANLDPALPLIDDVETEADMAKKLLSWGASPDLADVDGNTALMKAAQGLRPQIVEALLAGGADPALRNAAGDTALRMAELQYAANEACAGAVVDILYPVTLFLQEKAEQELQKAREEAKKSGGRLNKSVTIRKPLKLHQRDFGF